MVSKPLWRQHEDALLWAAPMVLIPAIAYVPIAVSLFIAPAFRHARLVGMCVVPLSAISEIFGLRNLAWCLRRDFDVISLFSGGIAVIFLVTCLSAGVIL